MTPEEFYYKADNEGGLYEAVSGYGLGLEDLEGGSPRLRELLAQFAELARYTRQLEERLLYFLEEEIDE